MSLASLAPRAIRLTHGRPQVPFAEDLRDYAFPALNFVKTRSGKILTEHPNIATDAMKSKMEELVDEMDLADPEDPEGRV